MYYEEKVINGILFYRNYPDKEWIEMSKEDLTARYIRTKNDNCVYAQLYEGWRDASKELPNVIDRYLVYVKHDMYREIKVYSFHPGDYDNSGWIHNARIVDNVIAWRPLPDPPAFV